MNRNLTSFVLLVLLSAMLATGSSVSQCEEKTAPKYVYVDFVPVFYPDEVLDYKLTAKGISAGYIKLWSGPKPAKGKPYELNFRAKCNRLSNLNIPFLSFEFFNTKASSKQDPTNGSCMEFTRYMDRDKQFLDETLFFNYKRMEVKQRITRNRDIRHYERYHLIEDKMLDPLLMLHHIRAVKVEKVGEKRIYHIFADGFWDATLSISSKKTQKYDDLGERTVWSAELDLPKPWLLFYTGKHNLEIDCDTGIVINAEWQTSKGRCKAQLSGTENSPLPFPVAN